MKAPNYALKIRTLDARITLLQAQRAELVHLKGAAAQQPEAKRAKPKKPSKKPTSKP